MTVTRRSRFRWALIPVFAALATLALMRGERPSDQRVELPFDFRQTAGTSTDTLVGSLQQRIRENPKDWRGQAHYSDQTYENRLGWREIVVRGGLGVAIRNSTAPVNSVSNELRFYPQDMLSSAADIRGASFTLAPGAGSVENDTAARTAESVGTSFGGVTERVAALVSVGRLSATVVAVSMLAAFFWGAAHALTPGHGKAVVAAYLIGARGTARHTGILGLTVTLTHTAGSSSSEH